MKEKPILFSGEMVRAILDGRKTQTRRLLKPQPDCRADKIFYVYRAATDFGEIPEFGSWKCRVNVGDCLWVKETHIRKASGTIYRADVDACEAAGLAGMYGGWKPSIFMRRVDSRITLEVTGVRCERVRDISGMDALAEGVKGVNEAALMGHPELMDDFNAKELIMNYQELWDKLNAERGFGWDTNPWVWVYEFRRLSKNGK